jgi:hypothetical protein
MVNKIILDYLQKYSKNYPLNALKQKIISSGYSTQEVEEASSYLSSNQNLTSQAPLPTNILTSFQNNPQFQTKKSGKIKWMKIAGIIGLVLFFISIISIIFSLIQFLPQNPLITLTNASSIYTSTSSTTYVIAIAVLVLSSIATIIFLYGFVKMGKYTGSKLLRFSAFAFLVIVILLTLLIIAAGVLGAFQPVSAASGSGIAGEAIGSFQTTDLQGNTGTINLTTAPMIIFLLIFLFIIVNMILFFIGMIKAGRQVKFAKIVGILGLIWMGLMIILIIAALLIIPPLLASILLSALSGSTISFSTILWALIAGTIINSMLTLAILLLSSTALLNVSQKFE